MNTVAQDIQKSLKQGGLWLIVMGILQVVVGFFAMYSPDLAGLAATIAVGVVLLFNSLFEFVASFQAPGWRLGLVAFLGAILSAFLGLVMLFKPALGLESLTIFLVIWFVIEGIDRIVTGIRLKGIPGRGWLFVGGVASIVLGVLIIADWPVSREWAVGLLVGINLVFAGWSKIFVGTSARGAGKDIEKVT